MKYARGGTYKGADGIGDNFDVEIRHLGQLHEETGGSIRFTYSSMDQNGFYIKSRSWLPSKPRHPHTPGKGAARDGNADKSAVGRNLYEAEARTCVEVAPERSKLLFLPCTFPLNLSRTNLDGSLD